MSILTQPNLIPQAVISNGETTGNEVQNPNNLLNTTDSVALFGATSDVIIGNYPFNLPSDAVVVGISGVLKARILNNSIPSGSITPSLIDVSTGTFYPGTAITGLSDELQEYSFGGEYDVWGNVTWNATKINNLRLQLIGNSALEVAWASLTVFYYIPVVTPVPSPFDLPGCDDCDSVIQALPFELAQPWLATDTKLVLKSFNLPDGTPITLNMIGECGGSINLTIDPDLRKEDGGNFIENFNIDSDIATITNLSNGTVEIDLGDIQQRGLGFSTPYGHDPALISEHAVKAVVIISNNGPFNSKLLKRCHIGTIISAPIEVQDEDQTVVVSLEKLNFVGPNVQAEQDSIDPRKANVTVIGNPTNVDPTVEDTTTGTNGTTPSSNLIVSHDITSANYLRVAVITEDETISDVTYDGVSMTFIGETINASANIKVALYGLINPNTGTHDVEITMANPVIISTIITGWLDVDTTNPVDGTSSGNIGSDDQPTDSATTTTENTVMQDVVGTALNPTTFTQYGLWAINGAVTASDRAGASSSRRVLAPQTVTDLYTIDTPTDWAIFMAGIRGISNPTPGSGVQTVTGQYIDNTDPQNPVSVVPRNNTAGSNPTVSNDNTQGYRVDSKWFNSTTGELYTCTDASTGAAVWVLVSSGSGGSLEVQQNGSPVETNVNTINFTGNVNVTNPSPNVVDIDIANAGSGSVTFQSTAGEDIDGSATPKAVFVGYLPNNLGTNISFVDSSNGEFAGDIPATYDYQKTASRIYSLFERVVTGQRYALPFTPTYDVVLSALVTRMSKGSFVDTYDITINIDPDNAGQPSGSPIFTNTTLGVSLSGSLRQSEKILTFGGDVVLQGGTTYWIDISISGSATLWFLQAFSGSNMLLWNGSAWVSAGGVDLGLGMFLIPTTQKVWKSFQETVITLSSGLVIGRGRFSGFTQSNAVQNATIDVQTNGTVNGFSSLDPVDYFLSNNAGDAGGIETSGTNKIAFGSKSNTITISRNTGFYQ